MPDPAAGELSADSDSTIRPGETPTAGTAPAATPRPRMTTGPAWEWVPAPAATPTGQVYEPALRPAWVPAPAATPTGQVNEPALRPAWVPFQAQLAWVPAPAATPTGQVYEPALGPSPEMTGPATPHPTAAITRPGKRKTPAAATATTGRDAAGYLPVVLFPEDPFKPEYFDKLAGYFVEAARRLPLAEIPYLADCLLYSALAIGLADPVTNILLTTIDAFAHTEPYMRTMPVDIEQTRNKTNFANRARSSWVALSKFLRCYFRYLADPPAHLLLQMAGFDLRVAIEAFELHLAGRGCPELLVPDSARTKTAFEVAGYSVKASQLVHLMTSSYPCSMVKPVLEDLRRGEKLTVACVNQLCEVLCNPWSPPPPQSAPTPGTSRDSAGGLTHVVCFGDGSFVTTHIKDGVATATFTASCPTDAAGFSEDATDLLCMFPLHPGRGLVSPEIFEIPDFLPFIRLQLLDMVHGVYLKAIAMLPVRALREGHLVHSLLTAGHCFGPLDPVANVVINTIWYDALFPLTKDVTSKLAAADILDARSMHRIESRSIDGLVAYLCSRSSPSTDEQDAVRLLCRVHLDTPISDLSSNTMCDVARAAKHPQPAAFGEFLQHESIEELYRQYCHDRVHGDPDSAFEQVKMALVHSARVAPVQRRCAQVDMDTSAALDNTPTFNILFPRIPSLMSKHPHIRGELEHLLIDYGNNHPLAPLYKLGVICGVTSQNQRCTEVFHANFLASSDGGSSWKLFFAEFGHRPNNRIEESEKSFCCPIPDDHKYPGRCVICEDCYSVIIHPQSRKYDMGNSQLPFPLLVSLGADTEKLDIDVIYSSEGGGGGVSGPATGGVNKGPFLL